MIYLGNGMYSDAGPSDELMHYGVIGMKWGVRKAEKYEKKANRLNRYSHIPDADTEYEHRMKKIKEYASGNLDDRRVPSKNIWKDSKSFYKEAKKYAKQKRKLRNKPPEYRYIAEDQRKREKMAPLVKKDMDARFKLRDDMEASLSKMKKGTKKYKDYEKYVDEARNDAMQAYREFYNLSW